eukprot:TRINITY_DN94363_c0_g1_i1.p1 TRINITY_DN94363_c0_g1~~TRINITY_DN94363_c0_g1_i1.p1  ORF type:complete len:450 (+),score=160.08 TRINITY_DN94363_c0_g1_i1:64-1350(+)
MTSTEDNSAKDVKKIVGTLLLPRQVSVLDPVPSDKLDGSAVLSTTTEPQRNLLMGRMAAALARNKYTTTVNVSSNSLQDAGVALLAASLARNKTVVNLAIGRNFLTDDGAKVLARSLARRKVRLKTLNVHGNALTTQGLKSLVAHLLPKCKCGETCDPVDRKMDENDELDLCGGRRTVESPSVLERLSVHGNNIGCDSGRLLCRLVAHAPRLQIINLNDNPLGVAVIGLATGLRRNNSVRTLRLSNTLMTDHELCALAHSLCGNRSVQRLVISSNNISDKGARALADMIKDNNTIEHIDISHTWISDVGAKMLLQAIRASKSALKSITIIGTTISDTNASAIAAAAMQENTTSVSTAAAPVTVPITKETATAATDSNQVITNTRKKSPCTGVTRDIKELHDDQEQATQPFAVELRGWETFINATYTFA